jgi:hypothetical protein
MAMNGEADDRITDGMDSKSYVLADQRTFEDSK